MHEIAGYVLKCKTKANPVDVRLIAQEALQPPDNIERAGCRWNYIGVGINKFRTDLERIEKVKAPKGKLALIIGEPDYRARAVTFDLCEPVQERRIGGRIVDDDDTPLSGAA